MFSKAIVRTPCRNMIRGLTSANLGIPDYDKALEQHRSYIQALEECGLEVRVLEADENYPDSTFVEDTALLTPKCAILMNLGAPSRRGETVEIKKMLAEFYTTMAEVENPGTADAGDIMMVDNHYYIGLSGRTNKEGANQIAAILSAHGLSSSLVQIEKALHLKTGLAYLEENKLVISGEFLSNPLFSKFDLIEIDENESNAANCVWINGKVLVPAGFPGAKGKIEMAGYQVIEVDVSEFRKLDGGLSCLSLRF